MGAYQEVGQGSFPLTTRETIGAMRLSRTESGFEGYIFALRIQPSQSGKQLAFGNGRSGKFRPDDGTKD